MRDPYSVLGVPRNAEPDAIKRAFKRLARECHPDVNTDPGAEETFKEINEAYSVLGDPQKRAAYDQFGEAGMRGGVPPDFGNAFAGFPGNVGDLLGSLFGDQPRTRRPARGTDLGIALDVLPMTAFLGGAATLQLPRVMGESGSLQVRIRAGARDGERLRIRGRGAPPPQGGPCGDLVVTLRITDHPVYRRQDDDLYVDVPISILEAIQGGDIEIPTPTGRTRVTLPPHCGGRRLRLRGRGVQTTPPGHLILTLRPTLPTDPTPEVLAAAQAIELAYGEPVRAILEPDTSP